jgi:hypothetical protein
MSNRIPLVLAGLAAAAICAVVVIGCGGGSDAAGTVGQIGPNLGDIAVNEADVLHAIRTGGGSHSHGASGHQAAPPSERRAKPEATYVGRPLVAAT